MHIAMIGTTAPSHVYPSLALIKELVARKHRVSYTTGEPLAGLVEPTGAEDSRPTTPPTQQKPNPHTPNHP
jgi:UDP:flavonoid glycosyltransferase YjiC (YdhE family)